MAMNRDRTSLIATTFLLCLAASPSLRSDASAQEKAQKVVIGEVLTIHSEVLDEERPVLVYRPEGYDGSHASYPVLYLLDGEDHFHHATGITQFLSRQDRMPQMIVIGLPNTDRRRDLSPARVAGAAFASRGGEGAFLRFLNEELVPFVDTHYRTQPYRVLIGHSLGGLFALHVFLTRPDAFNAYVAISPVLGWNDRALLPTVGTGLRNSAVDKRFLFLTVGDEGEDALGLMRQVEDILQREAPDGLVWHYRFMEKENHGSIVHKSIYDGLEALYADWMPEELAREMLDEIDEHFRELSQRYGYEIPTPERIVNSLGYRLLGYRFLGEEKVEEAIAVFERNVEMYPQSANVYDSLGDALQANGQLERAEASCATAYRKAVKLSDPNVRYYKHNLDRIREKLRSRSVSPAASP